MSLSEKLTEIYRLLFERFGEQGWWPGESEFEIMVGAILTQNTNWGNVEKAIGNLKEAGFLDAKKINEMGMEELAELIRPAGYYNVKARRLKSFINWLFERFEGELERMREKSYEELRAELLGVKGIGRETADSILLYALGKRTFVVDAYTARVLVRHMLVEPEAGYDEMKELFEGNLTGDVELFNEYHALLVRVGKDFCRPKARCEGCPLEGLPHQLESELW